MVALLSRLGCLVVFVTALARAAREPAPRSADALLDGLVRAQRYAACRKSPEAFRRLQWLSRSVDGNGTRLKDVQGAKVFAAFVATPRVEERRAVYARNPKVVSEWFMHLDLHGLAHGGPGRAEWAWSAFTNQATSDGVVLLDYGTGTNWADSLTEFTYAGMTFEFCVDGCDADITVGPYYDGSSYNVVGDASYYDEYLYLEDAATEDLVVSVVSSGSGPPPEKADGRDDHATGTLSVLYDCPGTCCECAAATFAPSPVPSGVCAPPAREP